MINTTTHLYEFEVHPLSSETQAKLIDLSMIVLAVHDASPAADLGIQLGWKLLQINSKTPSESGLRTAQKTGCKSLVFFDPQQDRALRLAATPWPFGLVLGPFPGTHYQKRVATRRYDTEEVTRFWKLGVLSVFETLSTPLHICTSRPFVGLFGRMRGKTIPDLQLDDRANNEDLCFLALSRLMEGRPKEALHLAQAARQSRLNLDQASYSTIQMALENYVEAGAAHLLGDRDHAVDAITEAVHQGEEIPEVRRAYQDITGQPAEDVKHSLLGKTFPLDYEFQAIDPIEEHPSSGENVRLTQCLSKMSNDQILIVMIMGDYRSNYYYNLDLQTLALIHHNYPQLIAEIHVVVAGTYALDKWHRRGSENMARELDLPFIILHDRQDQLSPQLPSAGYSDRYVLNRHVQILATERFMEEEGIWASVQRQRSL